jgi:hypothetical protein
VLIAPASSQVSCFLGRDPERRDVEGTPVLRDRVGNARM